MFHAQWDILLDEEFMNAYEHGMVIECCDGVRRRFYPRIFTYSADYPEKYVCISVHVDGCSLGTDRLMVACLKTYTRGKGCACPRCLIPLERVHKLATKRDRTQRVKLARVDTSARRNHIVTTRVKIYEKGYVVDSDNFKPMPDEDSSLPTSVSCRTYL